MPIRGYFVWGGGTVVLMTALILFAVLGWPTHPDSCTNIDPVTKVQVLKKIPRTDYPDFLHPDTCYCEAFDPQDVVSGKPGVRQWVNTFSNLYAIATSLIVLLLIQRDRARRRMLNLFHDPDSWIPEVYVFAVLFVLRYAFLRG